MISLFRSIRWKLVSSYITLAFVILGLTGFLASWAIHHFARQQEIQYLTATAEAIADQAYKSIFPFRRNDELQQLVYTSAFFGNVRVRILDAQKKMIADSSSPRSIVDSTELIIPQQIPEAFLKGFNTPLLFGLWSLDHEFFKQDKFIFTEEFPRNSQVTIVKRVHNPWGSGFTFELIPLDKTEVTLLESNPDESYQRSNQKITIPIGQPDEVRGYVELSSGIDYGIEVISTARKALIIAASSSLGIAIILGLVIGSKFSKPITNLIETSRQMTAGNFGVRAKIESKDEIGELSSQFNVMAEELHESFQKVAAERDALRRFIADASHELRTPITALKNFNDLLLETASSDPETIREFLQESKHQIDRLIWITNNLLDFSRWDAGFINLNITEVNTLDLLNAVRTMFLPKAEEKKINLVITTPSTPDLILCDRFRMEIAIGNLVDNAIKFSPENNLIEIGSSVDSDKTNIWVKDDGIGIPIGDQPNILDRFYRGHNQKFEGSGLGLSIASSIIKAHKGEITFLSNPESGSTFTLAIPKSISF